MLDNTTTSLSWCAEYRLKGQPVFRPVFRIVLRRGYFLSKFTDFGKFSGKVIWGFCGVKSCDSVRWVTASRLAMKPSFTDRNEAIAGTVCLRRRYRPASGQASEVTPHYRLGRKLAQFFLERFSKPVILFDTAGETNGITVSQSVIRRPATELCLKECPTCSNLKKFWK